MQRVLETARKLGLPVVVTDILGREPMVVLPLEQFEAMAGSGSEVQAPDIHREEPKRHPLPEEKVLQEEFSVRPQQQKPQETTKELSSISEEIPVEERFYVEPMEDGGTV